MELQEVIQRRRTIRDFAEKEVPFGVVEKALTAGLMAPSYNHQKEWYFVLVRDEAVRIALTQADNMSGELPEGFRKAVERYEPLAREMYQDAIPKQKRMILTASGVLVVVYKPKTRIPDSKRVCDLNCLAAVWACIENILLTFTENEVYCTTVIPEHTTEVKRVLNIPQELEVAAMIPFGYKSEQAKPLPQKEVALELVLHRDRWK